MALYKLFFLRDGEPIGQLSRRCAGDADAIEAARQVSEEYTVEVYQDGRLVGCVMRDGRDSVAADGLTL